METNIETLPLNKEKTLHMFSYTKEHVQRGLCYNNAVEVLVQYHAEDFTNGLYQVGYGYVGYTNGPLVRHCFIVTNEDEIIDLSALTTHTEETFRSVQDTVYVVFAKLTLDELKTLLALNDWDLVLAKPLKDKEMEAKAYMEEHGYIVHPHDYNTFLATS